MTMNTVVNVLTRTSNRPRFFYFNHQSVTSQSYPRVIHHVSYDDEATHGYVQMYPDLQTLAVERQRRKNGTDFPFNEYCNLLMQQVKSGWVMFLDDDDLLSSPDSIAIAMRHVKDEDTLLLWKVQLGTQIIPKKCFGREPLISDVSAIGFMFHSKHIQKASWESRRGGDFKVIHHLYSLLKPVWIGQVLTQSNYPTMTGGFGHREDCRTLTAKQLAEYQSFVDHGKAQNQPMVIKKKLNVPLKKINLNDSPIPRGDSREVSRTVHVDDVDDVDDVVESDEDGAEDAKDADDVVGSDEDVTGDESETLDEEAQEDVDDDDDDDDDDDKVIHPKIQRLLELFVDDQRLIILPRKTLDAIVESILRLETTVKGLRMETPAPAPAPTEVMVKGVVKGKGGLSEPARKPNLSKTTSNNGKLPTITQTVLQKDASLEKLLQDFDQTEPDESTGSDNPLEQFDMVYFIDVSGRLSDATIKTKLNPPRYQIIKLDNRQKLKINLLKQRKITEIIRQAKAQKYQRILLLQDDVLYHRHFNRELSQQLAQVGEYKILYLGGLHQLNKNFHEFDARTYLEFYPELVKAGIKTEKDLKNHWDRYGHKERRIGSRMLYHPEGKVQGTFAVALDQSIYDDLLKGGDNPEIWTELQKKYDKACYVMRPNVIAHNLGDFHKQKNRQRYLEHQWIPESYLPLN